jgi:hypothetical protein
MAWSRRWWRSSTVSAVWPPWSAWFGGRGPEHVGGRLAGGGVRGVRSANLGRGFRRPPTGRGVGAGHARVGTRPDLWLRPLRSRAHHDRTSARRRGRRRWRPCADDRRFVTGGPRLRGDRGRGGERVSGGRAERGPGADRAKTPGDRHLADTVGGGCRRLLRELSGLERYQPV